MSVSFQWTDAAIDRLKTLVKEKLSANAIAAKLSAEFAPVARNAVIGKIHRLGKTGFPQLRAPVRTGAIRAPKAAGKAGKKPRSTRFAIKTPQRMTGIHDPKGFDQDLKALADLAPARRPVEKPTLATRLDPPLGPAAYDAASRHLRLDELQRGDCRFPVTDDSGGAHRFCGSAALPGPSTGGASLGGFGPYCAHHQARCGGSAMERSAERPRPRATARAVGEWGAA